MENQEEEKIWWILRGEQREGPYTRDQLKSRAAAGKITAEDQLWKEGLSRPVLAASVRGLIADPAAPDPYTAPRAAMQAPEQQGSRWRQVLMIGGAVFFVLLLAGGVGLALLWHTGSQLDTSSKAYVDTEVPAIFGQWNVDELVAQATPQFLKSSDRDQSQQMFQKAATALGAFRSYDGARGQAIVSVTPQTGRVVAAEYEASLSYANGPATVDLRLVQQFGYWRIMAFRFHSPLLEH